jgi:hypothetical protein
MKNKIILIVLFVVANFGDAKIEQNMLLGSSNTNLGEKTTSAQPNCLANSPKVVSAPIETSENADEPKQDSKKPKRNKVLNTVILLLVGLFIFLGIYLQDWEGPM